jgi:hypothetical protein
MRCPATREGSGPGGRDAPQKGDVCAAPAPLPTLPAFAMAPITAGPDEGVGGQPADSSTYSVDDDDGEDKCDDQHPASWLADRRPGVMSSLS